MITVKKNRRQKLFVPPIETDKVLLHICCAPCSATVIQTMIEDSGLTPVLFFFNPNIHPYKEYLLRKNEIVEYALRNDIEYHDGDYNPADWFQKAKQFADEPEKGKRCDVCFDIRLENSAQKADELGIKLFATSLGMSRKKDQQQVYSYGHKATEKYPDLTFWDVNWRKGGNMQLEEEIKEKEKFYRQNYCGCIYSRNSRFENQNNQ